MALPLVVGVSAARISELRPRRDEAVEAAEVGVRLGGAKVITYWSLGLLDWLYHLPAEAFSGQRLPDQSAGPGRPRRPEQQRSGQDPGSLPGVWRCALAEAAGAINVHRNTLLYRLGRIEALAWGGFEGRHPTAQFACRFKGLAADQRLRRIGRPALWAVV